MQLTRGETAMDEAGWDYSSAKHSVNAGGERELEMLGFPDLEQLVDLAPVDL
jgi:hypothetical protein